MIELLNRRFVPFFFNTGGPGLGKDAAAAAFVKGKVKNKWAHLAGFKPEGQYLSESAIYADKNDAFDYLIGLLKANPDYNAKTAAEKATIAAAATGGVDAKRAAAKLHEELGEYDAAVALYGMLKDHLSLARIARYRKQWDAQEKALAQVGADGAEVALEHGYRHIARKKYAEARALLTKAIAVHAKSKRLAELRFYAGVACWFLEKKDRAYYHWCWVVEHLPDDRLARRCYIAAAAEGMPYANPELAGYRIDSRFGSIDMIKRAYAAAKARYETQKD